MTFRLWRCFTLNYELSISIFIDYANLKWNLVCSVQRRSEAGDWEVMGSYKGAATASLSFQTHSKILKLNMKREINLLKPKGDMHFHQKGTNWNIYCFLLVQLLFSWTLYFSPSPFLIWKETKRVQSISIWAADCWFMPLGLSIHTRSGALAHKHHAVHL